MMIGKAQLFIYLLLRLASWPRFFFEVTSLIVAIALATVVPIGGEIIVGLLG